MATTRKLLKPEIESKLRWPDGWERTRIQDRKPRAQWKKTFKEYEEAVTLELILMGAESVLITYNAGTEARMDTGVSVWFSRRKADFSWQDILGLDNPAPTLDEIDKAFRQKAVAVHPDRADGGDPESFRRLNDCRNHARNWVRGVHDHTHDFVIPCDRYNAAGLNLAAIVQAVRAFRSLDRVGIPGIMDRAIDKTFKAALPMHAGEGNNNNASVA